MQRVAIGKAAAFPNPGRKVLEIEGVAVGVFCRDGKFTAFENVCPHMGGPVCQGKIIARVQELVAPDKTSLGLVVLQGSDQHRLPLAWLRVRHQHRPASGQSPPAAAAGEHRGRRWRSRRHAPRGHARPDCASATDSGARRAVAQDRAGAGVAPSVGSGGGLGAARASAIRRSQAVSMRCWMRARAWARGRPGGMGSRISITMVPG